MYEKHENLLRKICHQFRNSGIEFEDLMGIGNEVYILTLKEFEESRKIKFTTVLYSYVKNTIINEIQRNKRRKNEIENENIDHFSDSIDIEKRIIFMNGLNRLSKEAQEVVQMVLTSPSDILENAGISHPRKMRGCVRKKLKEQKWPERKIWKIFREIKEVLK